jgi:hypothetical protein
VLTMTTDAQAAPTDAIEVAVAGVRATAATAQELDYRGLAAALEDLALAGCPSRRWTPAGWPRRCCRARGTAEPARQQGSDVTWRTNHACGVAATAVASKWLFNERLSCLSVAGIGLIAVGVLIIELGATR